MEPLLTIEKLVENLQIENIVNISSNFIIRNISTDTRTITADDVFIALRGSRFDGHNFVEEAYSKGASICIVEQNWYKNNPNINLPLIVVKDTLFFLGELANLYREHFDIPFIAVAGSNGKTTTKDFIAHILSQKYNVLKTEGNLNNLIGVPLTLFRLKKEHQVAVLEIGTNQPGEIARLCEIIQPTDGVITNIGKEHLEFFFDLDGVEMEETTLFGYLFKHAGFAFVNMDDPRLMRYSNFLENKMTYGTNENSFLQAKIKLNDELTPEISFTCDNINLTVRLHNSGLPVAYASIPAVAVGIKFGLNQEEINKGLKSFKLPETNSTGRMLIKKLKNAIIINDTYNANPSSMQMALENLKLFESSSPKIAVLGDMLELGNVSKEEHKTIINLASEICQNVLLYGEEMKNALVELPHLINVSWFPNKQDIVNQLLKNFTTGEIVLFKASRGMKCEEILWEFVNKLNN